MLSFKDTGFIMNSVLIYDERMIKRSNRQSLRFSFLRFKNLSIKRNVQKLHPDIINRWILFSSLYLVSSCFYTVYMTNYFERFSVNIPADRKAFPIDIYPYLNFLHFQIDIESMSPGSHHIVYTIQHHTFSGIGWTINYIQTRSKVYS